MPSVDVERRADDIRTSWESRMLADARQKLLKLDWNWRLAGFSIEHRTPGKDTSDIYAALWQVYNVVLRD